MTERQQFMMVAFTVGFAMSAGACIQSSRADSSPAAKVAALPLPSRADSGPRMHGCTTRFAIGPARGPRDSCALQPGTASPWKILPFDPEGGRIEVAWRATPYSPDNPPANESGAQPFCVYEWTGKAGPSPEDFRTLGEKVEPECGLSVAMATGSVPPDVLKGLYEAFQRQARGLSDASKGTTKEPVLGLGEATPHPPTIAVVDATPFGLRKPDTSGHGFSVSRVIGSLACADVNSAACDAMIKPYLALSLVQKPGAKGWVADPNGGFIGYFHDLFRVFNRVLRDWNAPTRKKTEHLIINLSLGWDPIKTDPKSFEVARMTDLLDRAYCEDVLVIAAAGNQTGSEGAVYPAALEDRAPPTNARCKDLKLPVPRSRAVYRPLIHAVGAVDEFDERMSVSRPWGQPRLAAYAMQVVASAGAGNNAGYTSPLTGTSMASAIVSGIAGAVWSANADLDAAGVMAIVYGTGERIDYTAGHDRNRTELCLADPKHPCQDWPVRRASLCRALKGALPKAALSCRPPAKVPPPVEHTAIPPELPASGQPPELVSPCRIAACGEAVGPMDLQLPEAVLPMPGVASCPACEFTMGTVLGRSIGTIHGTWETVPTGIVSATARTSLGGSFPLSPPPRVAIPFSKSVSSARPASADVLWLYNGGISQYTTTPLKVD